MAPMWMWASLMIVDAQEVSNKDATHSKFLPFLPKFEQPQLNIALATFAMLYSTTYHMCLKSSS